MLHKNNVQDHWYVYALTNSIEFIWIMVALKAIQVKIANKIIAWKAHAVFKKFCSSADFLPKYWPWLQPQSSIDQWQRKCAQVVYSSKHAEINMVWKKGASELWDYLTLYSGSFTATPGDMVVKFRYLTITIYCSATGFEWKTNVYHWYYSWREFGEARNFLRAI